MRGTAPLFPSRSLFHYFSPAPSYPSSRKTYSPPNAHTNSLTRTLSLSLSLSHTHTHTYRRKHNPASLPRFFLNRTGSGTNAATYSKQCHPSQQMLSNRKQLLSSLGFGARFFPSNRFFVIPPPPVEQRDSSEGTIARFLVRFLVFKGTFIHCNHDAIEGHDRMVLFLFLVSLCIERVIQAR